MLPIDQVQIFAFILVFLRCSAFLIAWPIFGGANLPVSVKVLMGLLLAFICFATVEPSTYPRIVLYQSMLALGVKEIIIGVAMGFLANLIFYAVSISGEIIGMSMGLTASQIFNPALGYQQSSVNQLQFTVAALLFLGMNGHHFLLQGLYQSFQMVPVNVLMPRLGEIGGLFMLGAKVLELGLMLAAPAMVAILLVNFSLGIMGRAVPQINVLITSMPVNALLGFAMMALILPFFMDSFKENFEEMSGSLFMFLSAF